MRLFLAMLLVFYSADSPAQDAPVLASVRVGGGCSGTVIWRGEINAYVLSCAHCCSGIGQEVKLFQVDGSVTNGRWIACDRVNDLGLIMAWSHGVLDSAEVALTLPVRPTWNALGFPGGVGPNQTALRLSDAAPSCGHQVFGASSACRTWHTGYSFHSRPSSIRPAYVLPVLTAQALAPSRDQHRFVAQIRATRFR